jgi:hypothetical protein
MTAFDPFATRAVRRADNLEPAFVHTEQVALARRKLDEHVARRGKRPNILIFLMDDVGWGDFGCYGGGVAVGAPTPNFDRLAAQGLRLTSCYSEPTCSPSRATLMTGRVPHRHGLHRPPMYGEPGGLQGEITLPQLLSDAGYVTQAVGKWHIGENLPSQPQNVGFDDFYGFLSVSDMYTEWRDPHYFPEIVYSAARSDWIRNMPFNKCFVHATRGKEAVNVEEVTIPVLSQLDETSGARIRPTSSARAPASPSPGCCTTTRAAPTSTTTRTSAFWHRRRRSIRTRTRWSSSTM